MYWNSKQLQFLRASQPIKIFLGGRGSGKTTCEGGEQYKCAVGMPRSKGFLSSTTYNQLLTKTLPAVESKWHEMGLQEGEDYVVGVRPPKNWEKCWEEPRKYENVISFVNGRRIELLSMDRPDLARGGSFTDGAVDEMALVPQEHVTRVLLPSLRMKLIEYQGNPLFRNLRGYTSIPWKPSGFYILDYEEKAKASPERYFFQESNAWDNVHVLGEEFIRMLEEELPYLEFLVEVMNERVRKVRDAFYHKFDADRHTYTPRYLYTDGERGISPAGIADPYYKPEELLDITFDFSGWFNCASVWQEGMLNKRRTEFCLHQFFVKEDEGKIGELVDKICHHYPTHKFRLVRIWGEPRGHDKRPDSMSTIYDQVVARFAKNGWKAEVRVGAGQVKKHKERAFYMNDVLDESNAQLPAVRFNDQTCKDIIIAMQICAVKDDFQKDKGREKDRAYPQEHAPHFTDGVDYYLMQKHGWRVKTGAIRPALSATLR